MNDLDTLVQAARSAFDAAPTPADISAIRDALAATAMQEFGSRAVTTLSGGERARVALARALATQDEDAALKQRFAPVAAQLAAAEGQITQELLAAQGKPVDIGGYYLPDDAKCTAAMRPSATLNAIIDGM